jgi:NAD(P)-dependent dehydrogenase (short-subunit alcohol dehydrogenase family)
VTDRVALVTGGGSGIGKAAALQLARDGFKVVIAGRRQDRLDEVEQAASSEGTTVVGIQTDVTKQDDVKRLFAQTKERFGRLDVLFNNAGKGAPGVPLEELTLQQWQEVVDLNLTGSFLCTQEAIKIMKDQDPRGGRIINNGSISAHAPRPNSAPYTSTKHAITGLTKATSLDGRKYDIACGQIDIGNAATEMASRLGQGAMQPSGEMRPEALMDVQDVAKAVSYMASLSLDSNVQFMMVMATKMPYVGRG